MNTVIKKLIEKIETCQKGECYKCEYNSCDKRCTDSLIDECYEVLVKLLKN